MTFRADHDWHGWHIGWYADGSTRQLSAQLIRWWAFNIDTTNWRVTWRLRDHEPDSWDRHVRWFGRLGVCKDSWR